MRTVRLQPSVDGRNIATGVRIPAGYYADQPYLTGTLDGGWLCVVTTGAGEEGARGQHVLSMKSFDQGKTWEHAVPLEDPDGPESSWGVPYTAPGGRVFVFYIHNTDDLREMPADDPPYPGGVTSRMDSHGHYVFRWSDDHGKTWSARRGVIPVRMFRIDRENPFGGAVRLFWNVGAAFEHAGYLYLPVHKVAGFGEGWFTRSEGALLRSDDLLKLAQPDDARWETLPDGETGICAPRGGGPIAEEHSFVPLGDGSLFCVFRTVAGYPGCSYSRDDGRTWEPAKFMRFADGRLMKHPRAANFVWARRDGGYLYSMHNHGGKYLGGHPDRATVGYNDRNPMWLCRGWEEEGPDGMILKWAEPEVGLYDDDPAIRISYPGFIEQDGGAFLTETQKAAARLHRLPEALDDALSASPSRRGRHLEKAAPLLSWNWQDGGEEMPMPPLPPFVIKDAECPYGSVRTRAGFALVLSLKGMGSRRQSLLENTGGDGSGLLVEWTEKLTIAVCLNDGRTAVWWESDPLVNPVSNSIIINFDGAAGLVMFYANGRLCDGGDARQFGWGRISPHFRNGYSGPVLKCGGGGTVRLETLEIYGRALTSAEAAILAMPGNPEAKQEPSPSFLNRI